MTGMVEERFHEVKKYYELVDFKGERIMTYRASCKQSGCQFMGQYRTEEGREKGIRAHRRIVLVKRRLRNAQIRFPHNGQARKALLMAQADSDTHELSEWLDFVDVIVRGKSGVNTHTLIDFDYEEAYRLGWSAHKAAMDSLKHQLDVTS